MLQQGREWVSKALNWPFAARASLNALNYPTFQIAFAEEVLCTFYSWKKVFVLKCQDGRECSTPSAGLADH